MAVVMETVTVADARKHFSELMAQVAYLHKRIVVERRGKPMAVIISVEDLAQLEGLPHDAESIRQQRLAALERAKVLRQKQREQGTVLTDSVDLINQLREERISELSNLY